jgi:hypothetical protein
VTRDRGPEEIARAGDMITSDRIAAHVTGMSGARYWKRDFLFRSGDWRGVEVKAFIRTRHSERQQGLVVGHSDRQLGPIELTALRVSSVRWVAGVNVQPMEGFSIPLPLGLTNDTAESDLHPILGHSEHIVAAWDLVAGPRPYKGTVYANFAVGTAPKHRAGLARLVEGRPDVIWDEPTYSDSGRIDYLCHLGMHDFVLCPRGNGLDTHRLWETLYMGGIPVVLRGRSTVQLTAGLPVVVVDDWKQALDADFRLRMWNTVRSRQWDYSPLSLSYWEARLTRMSEQRRLAD